MPKIPQYTKEALDEALGKINTKTMSLRAVAKRYNIPRATLQFKLKNPTSKSQFGPTPYLTSEEENTIEEWLVKMARKAFRGSQMTFSTQFKNFWLTIRVILLSSIIGLVRDG